MSACCSKYPFCKHAEEFDNKTLINMGYKPIEIISDEMCAKILAWLCCVGIRDERSTQPKVFEIIQIAKDRANFHAGKEPVWRIQIKISNYIKEFERGNKEFVNEVEQLFNNK